MVINNKKEQIQLLLTSSLENIQLMSKNTKDIESRFKESCNIYTLVYLSNEKLSFGNDFSENWETLERFNCIFDQRLAGANYFIGELYGLGNDMTYSMNVLFHPEYFRDLEWILCIRWRTFGKWLCQVWFNTCNGQCSNPRCGIFSNYLVGIPFLPCYSPELNPIERFFGYIKNHFYLKEPILRERVNDKFEIAFPR
ncbi:hypothetical protein ACTA71_003668 [Dictyostelium dimigraforme]